jgi:phosphinothricin acetyltransferase
MRRHLRGVAVEIGRYMVESELSRMRQLRVLRSLDDRLLDDVGLTRARVEAARPALLSLGTICDITIRDSIEDDLPQIERIYAHHVLHGAASFEEKPPSCEELAVRRRDVLMRGLPYLVAEWEGRVIGYSYAAPYRTRAAYRYTLENSIYIANDLTGRGVGHPLLARLIERCEAAGYRQMIAVIGDSANNASITLHRRLGFDRIGVLPSVGWKFGRWVDSVLMSRRLGPGDRAAP